MAETRKQSIQAPKCPTCGGLSNVHMRPFCSKRCADIDLGRWFQGKYAVPAVESADDTIVDAALVNVGISASLDDDDYH